MKPFLILHAILPGLLGFSYDEHIPQLKGMQQLTIFPATPAQQSVLKSFEDNPNIDFLRMSRPSLNPVDVLVTADEELNFKKMLNFNKIQYNVTIEDVEKAVAEERFTNTMRRMQSRLLSFGPRRIRAFNYYPRFAEIEEYLTILTQLYNKTTKLIKIGQSHEGRSIYVVKISNGGQNKPAILIDAGIHAREWIAPSTALYALHQLVTNQSTSDLYANVDWYILPSLNPDGYEYTHESYRFWRKTRSSNANSRCVGTDANRNFDFKWMTIGASNNPCSDTYAGSKAFSEVETCALRNFMLANKDTIKVYLTLHSYGQYLLHPWGWTSDLPTNEPLLREVGVKAAAAVYKEYGTEYVVGSSTNVLYAAAGGSDDWALAVAGVDLAYTIELPGGRFDPPASRIVPVGIETFQAFKVFQQYIAEKYISRNSI
ncbi:carboxypeptidase B [Fopius arisanus]|uniref:CBPB_4 protein n=1 Tax=Fopius arisanus TaxID=64838 RepID=A0A0C9RMM8_9HYME|nr:PREDICTED: carboxypeptidase B [Fopius arisanus]